VMICSTPYRRARTPMYNRYRDVYRFIEEVETWAGV
jgi:kynureninase